MAPEWRTPVLTLVAIVMFAPGVVHLAVAQPTAAAPGTTCDLAGASQAVKLRGAVTAIDAVWRAITLEGPRGRKLTITAGPQVKNFAEIKVGDQVDAEYIESLTVELKKGGQAIVGHREKASNADKRARAELGREMIIVGEVVNLDPETQIVTLRGPGRYVELKLCDPVEFKLIATGERVEVVYTEALALSVGPVTQK